MKTVKILFLAIGLVLSYTSYAQSPGHDSYLQSDVDLWLRETADTDYQIYVSGNTFRAVYKNADADSVMFLGPHQEFMNKVMETALWEWSMSIERIDELITSVYFLSYENGGQNFAGPKVWIGPDVEKFSIAEELDGVIDTVRLKSQMLPEPRRISYYLPPEYSQGNRYPVVYCTDGFDITAKAKVIEPLIRLGVIPPIVLVGVSNSDHNGLNNGSTMGNIRAHEYLKNYVTDDRYKESFDKHKEFFMEEVSNWAEMTLGVSSQRDQKILAGESNGASFVASMALEYPNEFGYALVFSMAFNYYSMNESELFEQLELPEFYLASGILESNFNHSTNNVAKLLSKNGHLVTNYEAVSGHDSAMWINNFARCIKEIFNK